MLAARGAFVIDADAIAREVVAPGSEGLEALVAAFGTGGAGWGWLAGSTGTGGAGLQR